MQGKEFRKYIEEDYKKVLKLRTQGFSFRGIAKAVGVSSTTALFWAKTKRKPRVLYSKRMEKILPLKSKKLSSSLAYIYGVLVGDGYIENSCRIHRICLNVTDKDFAEKFRINLEAWSDMKPSISERTVIHNHKTKYGKLIKGVSHMFVVRLTSKQAVEFLLTKIKCKTYDWNVPEDISNCSDEEIICNFLKGFFDSEGCVIYNNRNRRVEAFSVNKNGIENIEILLEKIKIKSEITQENLQTNKGKTSKFYTLQIRRRRDLELFAGKVNFSINRKTKKLKRMLKSYKRYQYQIEEAENKILESLIGGPKTVKDVSKIINRSARTTYYHITNLKREGN